MDELEELLAAARAETNGKRTRESPDPNKWKSFKPNAWVFVGQTELFYVQEDCRTILGLFDEYRHEKVVGCRKLVAAPHRRDGTPLKMEEVEARYWAPGNPWLPRREEKPIDVLADISLFLGQELRAEAVECYAVVSEGALYRLCTKKEAVFVGHNPKEVVTVPPDTDLSEVLTRSCKEEIWKTLHQKQL